MAQGYKKDYGTVHKEDDKEVREEEEERVWEMREKLGSGRRVISRASERKERSVRRGKRRKKISTILDKEMSPDQDS